LEFIDNKGFSLMMRNKKIAGFTLVEIMISLFVLTMMALSFVATAIQARKMSEAAVYHATALSAAQGYIEQIMSMEYQYLINAYYAPGSAPLPTKSDENTDDPLYLNVPNTKQITVDVDKDGNTSKTLEIIVTPKLTNLSDSLNYNAMEITLEYEWEAPGTSTPHKRALRIARSYVPTF